MTHRQLRKYQMLVRLHDFGTAHADRFPETSLADEAFASIGEAVTQLNTHAVERLALRRQGAKARAAARAALVKMLDAVSRTARVLQAEEPDFPNTFLMPEGKSAQAVLTAARLFVRDVEPFVEKFIAHAFATTFFADFKRLLQDYEQAVKGREAGKGQTAAARALVEAALASGIGAGRRLDVIVTNHLGDDPVAVAEWRRNRRIGYRKAKPLPEPTLSATEAVEQPATEPSSTDAVAQEEEAAASATPLVAAVVETPATPAAIALVPANTSPPAATPVLNAPDVTDVADEDAA